MKWIFLLLFAASSVLAQPQQSESFCIAKAVLDGSGALSASPDFQLTCAFGQPSPLGLQSSADFTLSGGFLSPQLFVSPLSPIQNLVIAYVAPDAILHWRRISGAHSYTIYRAADMIFAPGPSNLVGGSADTSYIESNILNLTSTRNYYIVVASNEQTPPSALSGMQSPRHRVPQTTHANPLPTKSSILSVVLRIPLEHTIAE
jgi:hypothetical protein